MVYTHMLSSNEVIRHCGTQKSRRIEDYTNVREIGIGHTSINLEKRFKTSDVYMILNCSHDLTEIMEKVTRMTKLLVTGFVVEDVVSEDRDVLSGEKPEVRLKKNVWESEPDDAVYPGPARHWRACRNLNVSRTQLDSATDRALNQQASLMRVSGWPEGSQSRRGAEPRHHDHVSRRGATGEPTAPMDHHKASKHQEIAIRQHFDRGSPGSGRLPLR
ncbi:hypothetical protein J6590_014110 [Homalodisca vitripennis]|nr:hypothetical protein J6590_014110 [Homalodisca vitripennis]